MPANLKDTGNLTRANSRKKVPAKSGRQNRASARNGRRGR